MVPFERRSFNASYGTPTWICRTPYPDIKSTREYCLRAIIRAPFDKIDDETSERTTKELLSRINGLALQKQYSRADIENAIAVCQELLDRGQHGEGPGHQILVTLGAWLYRKYQRTRSVADLEDAAKIGLEAVASMPEHDENRVLSLFNLLQMIGERYKSSKTTGALDDLVHLGRQVYDGLPLNDKDRPGIGANLLDDLIEMFNRTKEAKFLDESIAVAKTLIAPSSVGRLESLDKLRNLMSEKYSRTSELVYLEDAITQAQEIVNAIDSGPDFLVSLNNLAILISDRYSHTDSLDDLNEAIRVSRLTMAHEDTEIVRAFAYNLSVMLRKKYESAQDSKDLAEALLFSEIAVRRSHTIHPEEARRLCNHAQCLIYKYRISPSLDILDEAIDYCDTALQMPSESYLDQVTPYNHLSTMLMTRFERLGALEDLHDAEKYSLKAADVMEKEHVMDPEILNTVASALGKKYSREGDTHDIDRAISFARAAVNAQPLDHANRRRNMGNLASWQAERYKGTGNRADITEAIDISHQILKMTPENHADRLAMLCNYAHYLLQRRDPSDIDEAIQICQGGIKEAVKDNPAMSQIRHKLAYAMENRFKSEGKEDDLMEALRNWSILAQDENSQPVLRIQCANAAAILLSNGPDWPTAYELISASIKLFPTIGIRGLSWDDRQIMMRELSGVSSLAASIALQAEQLPSKALELQEAGRGVLATAVIDSRSSLLDLKGASAELYEKYIEQRASTTFLMSQNERSPADGLTMRSRNIRKLENLEKCIRETTCLKSFGLPLAATDLMRLAGSGYIVSFNVSVYRSDAFLVTQNKIEVLRLPDLDYGDLQTFVQELPSLTNGPNATYQERNKALKERLKWLWEVAVLPVLEALGLMNASPKPGSLPRLWWVISGLVGQTPLHAAGDGWGKSTSNTASHVVSSYIPTFKMLASAREMSSRAQREKSFGVQIVAMPQTTGFSDLSTEREIEAIRTSLVDQGGDVDVLQTPRKQEVITALPKYSTVHFACHGISDPTNPSNSSLLLANGELLTLRELADVSLPQARIAYLSACSTAQHSAADLRDEVLHVASAFQLVGFPHVLGTLWEADDGAAVRMAGLFYKELAMQTDIAEGGKGNHTDEQIALAHFRAVERLRNGEDPTGGRRRRNMASDVISWATFVHLGC